MDFTAASASPVMSFSYTNHTIMAEALETWTALLMEAAAPGMFAIIEKIDASLAAELAARGVRRHSRAHGHRGGGERTRRGNGPGQGPHGPSGGLCRAVCQRRGPLPTRRF